MLAPAPNCDVIVIPGQERITHMIFRTYLGHVWQRLAISPHGAVSTCIVIEIPVGRVHHDGHARDLPAQ